MRQDVVLYIQPEAGAIYQPVYRLTKEPEETSSAIIFHGRWISQVALRLVYDLGQTLKLYKWKLQSGAGEDDFEAFMMKVHTNMLTLSKGSPQFKPIFQNKPQ